jgi:hypothetical protein
MRPQLGSWPKMALFARLLPATLLAITRASASLAAPLTLISTRHVAPSPSQAMLLARPCVRGRQRQGVGQPHVCGCQCRCL